MGKIYKNDVGKEFRCDTKIDCSAATKKEIHVLKPDGITEVVWTADSVMKNPDTGIDSILVYTTTQASELDQIGTWKAVAYVEFSAQSKHFGEPDEFRVYDKYE